MRTWIFQSNPLVFKVNEYLENNDLILWSFRQKNLRDDISIGDIVYIWRSDGNKPESGGIVGKGEILCLPQKIKEDAPDLWIERQEDDIALRVLIKLKDTRLTTEDGMLRRVDLENDEILQDMYILQYRSRTNYKLEPRHAERINALWNQKK
jgi:predicted RNA-binding protein with PUA-like domain